VVLYDPYRDVAVLWVAGLHRRPLPFAGTAHTQDLAFVAGYPSNKTLRAIPARVGSLFTQTGPSIYRTGQVHRSVYSLRGTVRPGNSGGPLLASNGAVYGIVFAADRRYTDVGYALATAVVKPDLAKARGKTSQVSTGGCA
jgi:S1-C subfamily serine protease